MTVEIAPTRHLSTLALQFRRFRANRLAMASVLVLALIVLACFLGPFAFPFTGEDADFDNISAPVNLFTIHPFGTDDYGRDLLIRVLEGGRVSLTIGFLGALVAGGIGVLYGAVAGYVGGRVDGLMMRAVEILYGFPYVILVILLSLLFGGGNTALFAAIVFTLWLTPAVIVRAQAQGLAQREFVLAARAGGDDRLADHPGTHRAQLPVGRDRLWQPAGARGDPVGIVPVVPGHQHQGAAGQLGQPDPDRHRRDGHRPAPAAAARHDAGRGAVLPEFHRGWSA